MNPKNNKRFIRDYMREKYPIMASIAIIDAECDDELIVITPLTKNVYVTCNDEEIVNVKLGSARMCCGPLSENIDEILAEFPANEERLRTGEIKLTDVLLLVTRRVREATAVVNGDPWGVSTRTMEIDHELMTLAVRMKQKVTSAILNQASQPLSVPFAFEIKK